MEAFSCVLLKELPITEKRHLALGLASSWDSGGCLERSMEGYKGLATLPQFDSEGPSSSRAPQSSPIPEHYT